MSKPTYEQVLKAARTAVKNEYEHPYHGRHYDNQSVLVSLADTFQALNADDPEDEELMRSAVREAEQEFNQKNDVEL
jgi:hypothetical protein